MPRGGGYSSLPGSSDLDHIENRNDTNSNNEASGQIASPGPGTTNLSTASLPIAEIQGGGASFTVPGPEGSPHSKQEGSRGKSTGARNAQEAGDGRGKGDADLTGGLPTAEGVFVGSPIDQSSLYQPGAGMLQHQATVVTSAPPAYGSSRGAAGASAVVTSTDGRPNSSHTVILVNNPGYGEWGRAPQPFACRACGFSGYSNAVQDPCSTAPVLAAACCCLLGLWPCSFIPFLIPDLRDTVHRCPSCHATVGRSRQF